MKKDLVKTLQVTLDISDIKTSELVEKYVSKAGMSVLIDTLVNAQTLDKKVSKI